MSLRVVTIGTFDLMHAGHRQLLAYGFELAQGPVDVGVNSDEFVRTYKGEPMERTWTRVAAVSANPRVGRVVVHDGDTLVTIHRLTDEQPSVLLIGSDWHAKDYLGQLGVTLDELKSVGVVGIFYAHRPSDGPSSTKLREATLVAGGAHLPVEKISRERLDRMNALTDRDPTWRDDRDEQLDGRDCE